MTVLEYLRGGFRTDCVTRAGEVAELLLRDGRAPWIGELRGPVRTGGRYTIYEPLVAAGRAWNAHFVCCCDGQVYDPIAGAPVPTEGYARALFSQDAAGALLAGGDGPAPAGGDVQAGLSSEAR